MDDGGNDLGPQSDSWGLAAFFPHGSMSWSCGKNGVWMVTQPFCALELPPFCQMAIFALWLAADQRNYGDLGGLNFER